MEFTLPCFPSERLSLVRSSAGVARADGDEAGEQAWCVPAQAIESAAEAVARRREDQLEGRDGTRDQPAGAGLPDGEQQRCEDQPDRAEQLRESGRELGLELRRWAEPEDPADCRP